jgi:phospholipid transport system substrate-binding protein
MQKMPSKIKQFDSRHYFRVMMLATFVFFASAIVAVGAKAQAGSEPQKIVEEVTQELFSEVKRFKNNELSEEAYFKSVQSTLDNVVNFSFIAANVMGQQAYSKATAAQRQAFANVFREGLVKSYSKGISGYANSEVKVVSVNPDKNNAKRVTVQQEVSDNGTVHKLDYTMVQGKSGEWKVINVTLNGVNLGMSFSSQFKSAARKHSNDLDKVIANWLADV